MKKIRILLPALLTFMTLSCSKPEEPGQTPAPPDPPQENTSKYDVFLLIGQSNMAGRGQMIASDLLPIPGTFLLGQEGMPEPATNPLNRYSTVRGDLSMQQISPGFGFALRLYQHTGRLMLLVHNARGGTTIGQWAKGTELYEEAVRRAKEGMEYGELRGILWHQGESNASSYRGYMAALSQLVSDLRSDLGTPDVPFVAGQIGYWHDNSAEFNAMIATIADNIPNSGFVISAGCDHKGDGLHFDRASQMLLGGRYAEEIIKLAYTR